jgi:hypothetical protein
MKKCMDQNLNFNITSLKRTIENMMNIKSESDLDDLIKEIKEEDQCDPASIFSSKRPMSYNNRNKNRFNFLKS